MNPTARSLAISSPMALYLSSSKRRRHCLTGLAPGKMLRLCLVTCLRIPSMSEGLHAKMSQFQSRKSVILHSCQSERPQPIRMVLLVSSGLICTALVSSVGLKAPMDCFLVLDSGATSVLIVWIVPSCEAWLTAAAMLRFSSLQECAWCRSFLQ
jgi:hypothetical protein